MIIESLTPKQQRFVDEYLIDLNATQAAIRAGYSRKTARSMGAENLTKPDIKSAVSEAMEKRSEEAQRDSTWVLQRLVEEVDADIADLFDEQNNIRPIDEWPAIFRTGLVAGFEVEAPKVNRDGQVIRGEVVKVRFSDRLRRIEMIGKHVDVQAFKERTAHEIEPVVPVLNITLEREANGK